jgi:hypothetical protein
MRRLHDTNIVFVHIPKNAGQAVTSCFDETHLSTDHSLHTRQDNEYMKPPFLRFCVIRNPVSRFISAYKYHCHMQNINTDLVQARALILNERLGDDINKFVSFVVKEGIDLQKDLWFKRQVGWLRTARPQIILRFESLKTDIEIIHRLVPQHFTGLKPVNSSAGRPKSCRTVTVLNNKSLEFIKSFYEKDFFYLSYGIQAESLQQSKPQSSEYSCR